MGKSNKENDVLVGKTLQVYRYAINQNKPVGVREVQRSLKFKSPTSASYHLNKLEEAGLLKQTTEGYIVERMVLDNYIKLRRILISKFLLLALFFATGLIVQILVFRPLQVSRDFVFGTMMIIIAFLSYVYLTRTTRSKNRL